MEAWRVRENSRALHIDVETLIKLPSRACGWAFGERAVGKCLISSLVGAKGLAARYEIYGFSWIGCHRRFL